MNYFFVGFFLFFLSCGAVKEKQMIGNYVPVNYKNTYDTITLLTENICQRKVYDKFNKLALLMNGKWYVEGQSTITFNSFFLNFDRDIVKFPELLKDTAMELSVEVSKRSGRIYFCTGYFDDESCYNKID